MATPIPQNEAPFLSSEVATALSLLEANREAASRSEPLAFRGVVTDSREDVEGKLFVALRGERFDGHRFVHDVVHRGARGVVVDRREPPLDMPPSSVEFRVDDTELALLALGGFHRRRFGGRVVGVSGSAGKTTTRSLISSLLESLRPGRLHSTRGNLNNQIGVAMTLLALPLERDVAVLELGTNRPGEIAALARAACPDVGVLTMIDLEHTEGLGGIDGVEAEEGALVDFLVGSGGVAFGNADDFRVVRQLTKLPLERASTYGYSESAALRIVERSLAPDLSSRLVLEGRFGSLLSHSGPVSRHRALAAAAAVAVADHLYPGEVNTRALASALARSPEAGRGALVRHASGAVFLDESYNSNPGSCRACIDSARELARALGAELTLVLGEMRELGAESAVEHQRLGQYVVQAAPERAWFVGGDAELAWRAAEDAGLEARFFATSLEAQRPLDDLLGPRQVILLKGSRGVRLERLLEGGEPIAGNPNSAKGGAPSGGPESPG